MANETVNPHDAFFKQYLRENKIEALLLATKFFIPQPHPHLVARRRLLNAFEAGLQGKLILVSAPAGSGKTTLLADWIGRNADQPHSRRVAWLALDEHDNDPVRFLTYVTTALQKAEPTLGTAVLALLQTPQPPPVDTLLPLLIEDLSQANGSFLVALDDYHLIQAQSIHQTLTTLVDYLPPNLTFVLLSRNDPPLPLARWRVRRELTEVRQRDLRFTPAEIGEFLHQELAVELPASVIAALDERTEGWIAGLQLAALSMAGRANVADFVQTFTGSHAYVVDYLTEEVLSRQPPELRRFLLQTAILNRLSAPLCDAVMGYAEDAREHSQTILTQLERSNLFVIPLDQERRWYRYHHLFADVLQKWLRQEQEEMLPVFHRRACGWYAQQGLLTDAIHHAVAAADFTQAATLIESISDQLHKRGEFVTLTALLRQLPDALVRTRPQLCLEQAATLMFQHQLDEAEAWLTAAEQAGVGADNDLVLRGNRAAIQTDIALNRGDTARAICLAQEALTYLPASDLYTRSFVMLLAGVAHFWSHQYGAAIAAYDEALQLARQSSALIITIYTLVAKAEVLQRQGLLQEVQTTLQQAFTYAREQGVEQTPLLGGTLALMGELHYEWNELEEAARCFVQSLARAQQARNPRTQLHAYTDALRVATAQQNAEKIQEIIQQAEQIIKQFPLPPQMVNDFHIGQWRLALQQGNHTLVADQLQAVETTSGTPFLTDTENLDLLRARLYIAETDYSSALKLLPSVSQTAAAINHLPHQVEALALTALAHAGVGDQARARQATQQLLLNAQPAGFLRTIVDTGPGLRDLLVDGKWRIADWLRDDQLLREQVSRYIDRLLTIFPEPSTDTLLTPISAPPTIRPLVEPLTERELEVLQLVNEGLSNNQIAVRLIVTVGTVKRHLNNIFGKLAVGSRTQALVRARELKLLR